MLLLGIDIGTSSVKATVMDAASQVTLSSASFPGSEAAIISLQTGWAEQDPVTWWTFAQQAILQCHSHKKYNPKEIAAIGISYQMHGLVLTDESGKALRNSIIWCDSRAVDIGRKAFAEIGEEKCLRSLLNSPGNFTASKLAWVKENEPEIYKKIHRIMLPGDYISMKFTGSTTTTISALSEGIFWDFHTNAISEDVMQYFDFDAAHFPEIRPVFSVHGKLLKPVAHELGLTPQIPVSYKAGDQPNNALALNVMQPGEVAATAGTSGVIYGVSDQLIFDKKSRINNFAHVNYCNKNKKTGVLLCLNGTGIFYKWIKSIIGKEKSYEEINRMAAEVGSGANELFALPFGNGAERILNDRFTGAQFFGIDFNVHTSSHLLRAAIEGIAFSFRFGLDMMRENGINPKIIRAARANMFLSDVFAQAFATINNVAVEFYEGDGSYGAAIGAGLGAGIYINSEEAAKNRKPVGVIEPQNDAMLNEKYEKWKQALAMALELAM